MIAKQSWNERPAFKPLLPGQLFLCLWSRGRCHHSAAVADRVDEGSAGFLLMADGEACEERDGSKDDEHQCGAETTATGLRGRIRRALLGGLGRGFVGTALDGWQARGGFFRSKGVEFFFGESEIEGHVANSDGAAAAQGDGFITGAVQLDAVGRSDVAEFVATTDPPHFRMDHRDRARIDGDIVFTAAAQGNDLAVELEPIGLGGFFGNCDRDARHGAKTQWFSRF